MCVCVYVCVCVLVAQLCLTLYNSMVCSPPGSSIHGVFQTRILECVAIPFSRGSSWSRDWTRVSCNAGRFFYHLSYRGSSPASPITSVLVLPNDCSVTQARPTLSDPMDCSTSGFPVLYHLLELAQTHVHWVSDAIQPSHPLSPSSPPAFNLSQHQGLFHWISSSYHVAQVLELQLQHQSFQ